MGGRGASSGARLSEEEIRQRNREYLAKRMEQGREVLRQSMQRDLENITPYRDNTKTVREETPDVRVRASNVKLNNKNSVIDFVKRQTGIDLSKVVEPRTARSRTYLGVHLEDLTRNQQNEVRRVLNAYGRKTRIGDNGGYGYAIYYQK